jgi:hypothetical protein
MFRMQFENEPYEEENVGGFNPLLLASVLVVVTILIAASLSFWATNISEKRKDVVSGKCLGDLSLYTGSYDGDQKKLSLIVDNNGDSIGDVKVYLDYSETNIKEYKIQKILGRNSFETIEIEGVDEGFLKGTITTECPTKRLEFTEENGSLKEL